jgi:hypothetical protein
VSTSETSTKLDTIHVLVNSRLTEALNKIDRLEARLHDVTGEVPTGEPPAAPQLQSSPVPPNIPLLPPLG